jgi:hypothetical protein
VSPFVTLPRHTILPPTRAPAHLATHTLPPPRHVNLHHVQAPRSSAGICATTLRRTPAHLGSLSRRFPAGSETSGPSVLLDTHNVVWLREGIKELGSVSIPYLIWNHVSIRSRSLRSFADGLQVVAACTHSVFLPVTQLSDRIVPPYPTPVLSLATWDDARSTLVKGGMPYQTMDQPVLRRLQTVIGWGRSCVMG